RRSSEQRTNGAPSRSLTPSARLGPSAAHSAGTARVEECHDVCAPDGHALSREHQVTWCHVLWVLRGAEWRIDLQFGGRAAHAGCASDIPHGLRRRVVFSIYAQDRDVDPTG